MTPTVADLENWLSFGRQCPLFSRQSQAPRADPVDRGP